MDLLSPHFPLVSYGAAKEAAKPEEKWGEGGGISPLVPTQDLYTPYHKGENRGGKQSSVFLGKLHF